MKRKKPPYPPAKYKQYIEALADYIQGIAFLQEYHRRIFYEKRTHRDDQDGDGQTNAAVTVDHIYLNLDIYCYPALLAKWREENYERVGAIVLHEFCHTFIRPVRHLHEHEEGQTAKRHAQETVERQTTRIQNTIAGVLPQGWYEPQVVTGKKN